MKQLKTALVLDDTLDTTDGVQQYVLTLGDWLSKRGHNVHYIVGRTKRQDIATIHSVGRNIGVRFNGNRMSMPLPASKKVLRHILRQQQFDVVHVQMPYSPFLAGRVIAAVSRNTAVVGTFHIAPQSVLVHAATSLLRLLTRSSLRRFDAIMSVSDVARQFAAQAFKVNSTVVSNCIDVSRFAGANPTEGLRSSLNIMFFGRLVERKGCRYFLEAVALLHREGHVLPDVRIVVCGTGPLEQSLKAFVHTQGLEQFVTFTGFVTEEDKPHYLAAADIVVYPSTGGESFGIVLLEGMAAGRGIVLAGDNPGYRSVLGAHSEALVDPKNTRAFAAKLQYYLSSKARRERAHQQQHTLLSQFAVDTVGKQIETIYTQALHKRRT